MRGTQANKEGGSTQSQKIPGQLDRKWGNGARGPQGREETGRDGRKAFKRNGGQVVASRNRARRVADCGHRQ